MCGLVRLSKKLYELLFSFREFNRLLMQKRLKFGLERCAVDLCFFHLRVCIIAHSSFVKSKQDRRSVSSGAVSNIGCVV